MKTQFCSRIYAQILGAAAISTVLGLASPAVAGSITVENPYRPVTDPGRTSAGTVLNRGLFCRYIPTGQSVLASDGFLTLIELQGNSTFRYERTDATLVAGLPPGDSSRSITFFNTTAEQARRQLANRPNDYANLLGLAPSDRTVRAGFGSIDSQVSCQPYDQAIAAAQQPGTLPSRQYSSIAALPDGNYRVTTAPDAVNADSFSTDNDSSRNGALFTFRKLGSTVTGNFTYLGSDLNACVTGTVEGNTVTGQAFTSNSGNTVIGQTYLGPGLDLRLGERGTGQRYDSSILNLNGFTRINAGTTTPPAVCS